MHGSRWLTTLLILCLFCCCFCRELKVKHDHGLPIYNGTLAKILVQYNAAVYESDLTELFTWTCSRCNGMTKGFEIIELIVDIQHCLQAYVGVARDLNAIIVAFRGTQEHSIQNWIEDLYWKQLDLNYPDMPDAMVHHGFYNAYHNTTMRPGVVSAVRRAKEVFGEIDVMVIGHSMGGAMAAICALDLTVHHDIKNVQVTTFGQPRVGNAAFTSYYSQFVPDTIRVTHEHDMVPHLPPYYHYFPQKTYHHFPREVWLNDIGFGSLIYTVEKVCDGSGEDPSCCRKQYHSYRSPTLACGSFVRIYMFSLEQCRGLHQLRTVSVIGSSVLDHLVYYGINLHAEMWSSCRIVTSPHLSNYKTTDDAGNIILSKDPLTLVLQHDHLLSGGAMKVA